MPDITTAIRGCGECPIRHRAVCARCEPNELVELDSMKYYRSFQAGQTVVWSGDKMDFVGSVVSGIASLTQTMEDGRTQMVGLFVQISERWFSFKPVTVNALCNMCGNCLHFLFIEEELLKRMKANKHPHHPV